MKAFNYWRLVIYIACASLAACAGYGVINSVTVTADKKTDFEKYNSFSWLPDRDTASNAFNNANLRENVRKHFANLFAERNISLTTGQPDLLMDIQVTTVPKEKIINEPIYNPYAYYPYPFYYYNYYGYSYLPYYAYPPSQMYTGFAPRKIQYEECTIGLKIYEKTSQKILWTGSATSDIHFKEEADKNYYKATTAIMERYPVKSRKEDRLFQ